MSPVFSVLYEIVGEIQENGLSVPNTPTALAKMMGVSAAQFSRIKNLKSSLSDKSLDCIYKEISKLEKDKAKLAAWKEKLKEAQKNQLELLRKTKAQSLMQAQPESSTVIASIDDPLEEFYNFFSISSDEITQGENRLICCSYRDRSQSTAKGRNPEAIERNAGEIKKGLKCAVFQCFGPLEEIRKNGKEAYDRDDVEAKQAWDYIYDVALGVYDVFRKTKAVVEKGDNKGQIVLYEASKVPVLTECYIHSRLFYSEQVLTKNKIRVVQLVIGKNIETEYCIECSIEPAFQSVIAVQFHPILGYWRNTGHLPETQKQIEVFYKNSKQYKVNKKCPWRIPE